MDQSSDLFDGTPEQRVATLVRLLTIERLEEDRFRGAQMPGGKGRIYGGQVVAQALAAAVATVERDREPHSLHAYFLRGGDEDYPVDFLVDRDFDGNSYANRRVTAAQNGKPILTLAASFQKRAAGTAHQHAMPNIPDPDELQDEMNVLPVRSEARQQRLRMAMVRQRAYEVRVAADLHDGQPKIDRPIFYWFRVLAPLPDDPMMHRLALAFLSDYGLLSAAAITRGLVLWNTDAKVASLDHAIWFHDRFRADEWIAYVCDSPWSGNHRGFNRGSFFTRDGRLVASTAQEGMMRLGGTPSLADGSPARQG